MPTGPALPEMHPGFEAHFFEELASVEAGNFWFRARNKLLLKTLKRWVPRAGSFLEVGCGTGFVLSAIEQAFPAMELWGSEIFQEGLRFAAGRVSRARLIQMDALDIPFEARFDAIGAFDVLEHIEQDERALVQMHKALKPGGRLILTVPQHPVLWSAQDEHAHHFRRYQRGILRARVERAGFRWLHATSFVSILLPAMFAARLRNKRSGAADSFDPMAELRIHGLLNTLLERLFINAGLSLPAGGSLLMVAEKQA